MGGELEVPEGWLPWWQRSWGGPLDVGGHHPHRGIIGTFVARGRRNWTRVLVFGFQERRLRSDNSPVPDRSSTARDEILGVRGCVKQRPALAKNSSSDTTTSHKVIIELFYLKHI